MTVIINKIVCKEQVDTMTLNSMHMNLYNIIIRGDWSIRDGMTRGRKSKGTDRPATNLKLFEFYFDMNASFKETSKIIMPKANITIVIVRFQCFEWLCVENLCTCKCWKMMLMQKCYGNSGLFPYLVRNYTLFGNTLLLFLE